MQPFITIPELQIHTVKVFQTHLAASNHEVCNKIEECGR